MRTLAIACGLLLAACPPALANAAVAHPDEEPAPQARFHYGDLDLRDAGDQLVLVERVQQAADAYCREHAAVVTPSHRLRDPRYCPSVIRAQLMWGMPREVRRAYDAGWRRRPVRRG